MDNVHVDNLHSFCPTNLTVAIGGSSQEKKLISLGIQFQFIIYLFILFIIHGLLTETLQQ